MREPIVLVVDDLADCRGILAAVLRHSGYDVVEAENGYAAVQAALRQPPDVILMDLQMPVMDGWAATAALRSHPLFVHTPILAVTASDEITNLRSAGFTGYLAKPFRPRVAVEAVTRLLRAEDAWVELRAG